MNYYHSRMADRLVAPESRRSLETPFSYEWTAEARNSYIPSHLPLQVGLLAVEIGRRYPGAVGKAGDGPSINLTQANREVLEPMARFLGLQEDSNREVVEFGLRYAMAVGETKQALETDLEAAGLDIWAGGRKWGYGIITTWLSRQLNWLALYRL